MTMIRTQGISSASICELTTEADIRAAQELRYKVWQLEGAVIEQPELGIITDKHDDHAIHWGAFDEGRLIGSARLCLHENLTDAPDGELFSHIDLPTPIASMNRMVVLNTHRGIGIGTKFDDVRLCKARSLGAAAIIATPIVQLPRKHSFIRRGFHFLPGVFLGNLTYAPTIPISACYLVLENSTSFETRSDHVRLDPSLRHTRFAQGGER